MTGPIRNINLAEDLQLDDLAQEIDAPLDDYRQARDETPLAKLDPEDLEIDL